jgi:sugar phosphate isomerase/epimerase
VIKYASPTFLFRDGHAGDILTVIRRIAECGYDGFELYGLFGESPENIKNICDKNGIVVMGDHIPYTEFVGETQDVIKKRVTLNTPFITVDKIPKEHLPGGQRFSETVVEITRIAKECKAAGLQLLYHNHGYDLIDKADGKYVLEGILDSIDPELVKFQPDLGWIELGGGDPSYFLEKYKDRCPVIHLKDYYSTAPMRLSSAPELGYERGGADYNFFEFRPTGYGVVNFAKYMPAVLACKPQWLVADHDLSYERDTFVDLEDSLLYVKKLATLYPGLL